MVVGFWPTAASRGPLDKPCRDSPAQLKQVLSRHMPRRSLPVLLVAIRIVQYFERVDLQSKQRVETWPRVNGHVGN